jgi:acetyl/propionyl-CoA carboxylase alpha subunit
MRGWAIECRISAEDPFNSFLPSVGDITFVSEPGGPGVRLDSALYEGLEISMYYDPLIAKLSTWGRNRAEAINRMRRALSEFKIVGVHTNIPFHLQVMDDQDFKEGRLDTGFVEKRFTGLDVNGEAEEMALLAAVLAHRMRKQPSTAKTAANGYGNSDWRAANRQSQMRRPWSGGWRRSI